MRFALLALLPEFQESSRTSGALGSDVDLTRYVLVCILTIGLVLACAWLLRRFVAQGLRKRASMRSLAVTDVLPLGRRQRALVLRCYDRSFLIGLGEREVTLLAELDPEAQEEFEPSPPAHNAPSVPVTSGIRPIAHDSEEGSDGVAPLRPQPGTRGVAEPKPVSLPVKGATPEPALDNFAETLASELPVESKPIQPGMRIPKEGLLG